MAYNSSKGPRELGDIKSEDDPDTQIDFENDQISLKTGGINRLTTTNTHVSCSVNISASAFYGDGSTLQGLSPITTYNGSGNNRIITSVNGSTVNGETNLIFDGSLLAVTGDISGSGTATFVGNTVVGGALNVSGNVFVANLKTIGRDDGVTRNANIQFADVGALGNAVIALRDGGDDLMVVDGGGNIGIGTSIPSHKLTVAGTISATGNITGSFISASAGFVGNGAQLTNLPGGDVTGPGDAIATAVATFQGTSGKTITGSAVTIDGGGNFTVPGNISGSANGAFKTLVIEGVTRVHSSGTAIFNVVTGSFMSASNGFVGDGSQLTNLPAAGDVTGPGDATATAVATFQGTSGKTITGSAITIDGGGNFTVPGNISGSANGAFKTLVIEGATRIDPGGGAVFNVITGSFVSASVGFVGDGSQLTNLPAAGDVTGPGDAIATSLAIFQGTSGKTITGSAVTMDPAGNISMPGQNLSCNQLVAGGGGVSSSAGISVTADAQRLSVGANEDFYIIHATNTAMAAVDGHLTLDVETSGKNLRLQLGDDAAASAVQVRNNSGTNVASIDSAGIVAGAAYGLTGIADGAISINDVIVPVGFTGTSMKFAQASPNTLQHGRGPFYVAYAAASLGQPVLALKSRLVSGQNTSAATNVGDAVYLSAATSGSISYDVPTPTADAAHFSLIVRVGRVVNVHAATGAYVLNPSDASGPLVGQVLAGGGTSTLVSGFGAAFSGSAGSCAVLATANTDPAPSDDDQIKSAFIRTDGDLQITLDDSSGTPLLTYTIFA